MMLRLRAKIFKPCATNQGSEQKFSNHNVQIKGEGQNRQIKVVKSQGEKPKLQSSQPIAIAIK